MTYSAHATPTSHVRKHGVTSDANPTRKHPNAIRSRRALIPVFVAIFALQSAAQNEPLPQPATPAESPAFEKPITDAVKPGTMAPVVRARALGPALTSGRIGDIAVNPDNHSEWYVAVASGGVWKTTNYGTTFDPVFDSEGSYSIGCVTIDPNNTNIVWVGTGENNSQRSVSFGDGVYKSLDGGKSWKNMGLHESEHIGMIAVDPRDSNTVYVAAQGPLWRSGGDRGLYKTTDGGETWQRILHVSDDTGINEIHFDPRNPDRLYASAYQRRRHVWTLINGGPESGLYKSEDAGRSWRKINRGLPGADKGRIGLDVSPANPDVLYCICEAANDSGGVYRSTDRGETWVKRNSFMSSSPQYYNELVCDPLNVDRFYLLETILRVSEDGGATINAVPIRAKHVDDHALWVHPTNTDHLICGSDGGIYLTWDRGQNWNYVDNLPVTQFYRVAVDNSTPFYFIYGGTQDNNTIGGPSRTLSGRGIYNEDWFITVGGDGFEPAIDPENPDIVYSQWQHGGLVRYDRRTGERVDIKPREAPGEEPYVFNWDSPLIISPHSHTRLYFAGRVVYRSDDRGDSWTVISSNLSRGIDRNKLEVMGRIQPPDAVAKHDSTSIYGNIVSLAESPLVEGLIYAGTDDGLVHVTENAGQTWRKIDAFPGVPYMTYVSCITASVHDPDAVFACFDNHKNGDFKPYILRSDDRGQSWVSITGDLGDRDIAYSIQQDHVRGDLLFLGTEFGARYSLDAGKHWYKVGGIPTISVRDVDIQRRENAVAFATFGRGFYVIDDYSPLQIVEPADLDKPAHIFPIRPALRFIEADKGRGSQGATLFAADNPPYGATFTYYIKDALRTEKEKREKKGFSGKPEDYPTLDQFRKEAEEIEPEVILTIRDDRGAIVRRIDASRSDGVHRATWDLRYMGTGPASPRGASGRGLLAPPGDYTVTISTLIDGTMTDLAGPAPFKVVQLHEAVAAAYDFNAIVAFQRDVADLYAPIQAAQRILTDAQTRLDSIRGALRDTPDADPALLTKTLALHERLRDLRIEMHGDPIPPQHDEPAPPSISDHLSAAMASYNVTSPPTRTQRDQYRYAAERFEKFLPQLRSLADDLQALEKKLDDAGAPWTPGRFPEWKRKD